ncbi:hypothetical protein AVEN_249098-1 [Araneus ventricosus]|uniref:Uncharacterized protein n=1 Tax=Araneus ventricosus TaxID=182803 RepID=A0A4Y2SKS5_ARAVE|nr:hypothetical protein AVEN_249098-1 [Araneus ventricosus]
MYASFAARQMTKRNRVLAKYFLTYQELEELLEWYASLTHPQFRFFNGFEDTRTPSTVSYVTTVSGSSPLCDTKVNLSLKVLSHWRTDLDVDGTAVK